MFCGFKAGVRDSRVKALPRFQGNILRPEARMRILAVIRAQPGLTQRALARETGLHPNVVRGHLQVLARQGHVVRRRLGSRILVYPAQGAPSRSRRAVAADAELRLDMQRRLLAVIQKHPGLRQDQILEATQKWHWPRATAQHRLGRLVEAGVVTCQPQGREKHYTAHPL